MIVHLCGAVGIGRGCTVQAFQCHFTVLDGELQHGWSYMQYMAWPIHSRVEPFLILQLLVYVGNI